MKTVYALPCVCGKTIEVDRSQAGLKVHCACGRAQEVPTIRGLTSLESRVQSEPIVARTWGPAQGVIFLGLAITVIAGTYALYCQLFPPTNPVEVASPEQFAKVFDGLTPSRSYELWGYLSAGIDRTELPLVLAYRERLERHERWTVVTWGVAGAGLVIAAVGAVLMAANRRPEPKRASTRPTPAS